MQRSFLFFFVLFCGVFATEKDVMELVEEGISNAPVMIFVKSTSNRSSKVMPLLDSLRTAYNVVTLDFLQEDAAFAIKYLREKTGKLTPPFIFVGGEFVTYEDFMRMGEEGTLADYVRSHTKQDGAGATTEKVDL